jgi:adenylate cyclase
VAMPGDGEKALSWLHKALDLEPDYAAAHALAAWCYEQRYLRGGMHEADKIAGLKHARTALATGADDPTTLATAGFVIGLVEHDYQTAMIAIDHALALNGSSALALGSAPPFSPTTGGSRRRLIMASERCGGAHTIRRSTCS